MLHHADIELDIVRVEKRLETEVVLYDVTSHS